MPQAQRPQGRAGREVLEAGDRGGDVQGQEERPPSHGPARRWRARSARPRRRRSASAATARALRSGPLGDARSAARVEAAHAAEHDDRPLQREHGGDRRARCRPARWPPAAASAAARTALAATHQRAPRRLCCFRPTDTEATLASTRTTAKATSRVGVCNGMPEILGSGAGGAWRLVGVRARRARRNRDELAGPRGRPRPCVAAAAVCNAPRTLGADDARAARFVLARGRLLPASAR